MGATLPFRRCRASLPVAVGIVLCAGSLPACALVTDLNVQKYKLAASNDGGLVGDANLCESGSCPTISIDCRSASDCNAGDVCCVVPTSLTSVTFACQAGPCGLIPTPLCAPTADAASAECSGGPCIKQTCSFDGVVVKDLGACGLLPNCDTQSE